MGTIERLKELHAEFQDEMSGISMEEFREIMNIVPKILAAIEAADEIAAILEKLLALAMKEGKVDIPSVSQYRLDDYRKAKAELK